MRTDKIPYWKPFKHEAPYKGMKWTVKTPRGIFGFRTKKLARIFVSAAGPYKIS